MSNEYSFSLTTFSPSGRLLQIEHAINAVNNHGQLALGIKAKNGVVVVTQRSTINNVLIDKSTLSKAEPVTTHIGCVFSGMPTDFRVVLGRARKEAQIYYQIYKDPIPVLQLVRRVAEVVQEYTQSGGVRPFGVSLLISGYDKGGPQLYQIDPSGTYFAWKATALGKHSLNAKTFLEKRYSEEMELEDALHTALLTLKESFEGSMNENDVAIGVVRENEPFRSLSSSEVKDYILEVQ
jgi:20S proteasome subunit alpha 2